MARRTRKKTELGPREAVAKVLAEREKKRIIYFPVKHFSPAAAWQVRRLIEEVRPVGVLVEGPSDATELLEHLVHPDTRPPVTIFSAYVDVKNIFELNGVLSPSVEIPARYRSWWPVVEYGPEYQALLAGKEVGAELQLIDAPLSGRMPYEHVREPSLQRTVDDRHLATSAYFQALAQRDRRRSFDEYWNATFEVGGWDADPWRWVEAVLLFAWATRNLHPDPEARDAALEADGTLARERHMRSRIDKFLKAHPDGEVVVVTGAFHSVALRTSKKKVARSKARKGDLSVQLTTHSYGALSTLYSLNRLPNYGRLVWEHMHAGSPEPYNNAALQLLVSIARHAREGEEVGVSTADAVGAYKAALNLSTLRRHHEATLEDLLDAAQMSFVKGDILVKGGAVEAAVRHILTGKRVGRVTPHAGQIPLMVDFYDSAKRHRVDVTGAGKVVRCDIHKRQKHRHKSAFLHQCDLAKLPMFGRLDKVPYHTRVDHYRGPDLAEGTDLHLITETWAVRWTEAVDDRLVELSDQGATLPQVAASLLREAHASSSGAAAETTKLLLRAAQMLLPALVDELLVATEEAIASSGSFTDLVDALADFSLLYAYRDNVSSQGGARLLDVIRTVFHKAVLVLPGIATADTEAAREILERLQALVRITLTFEGVRLDRELLVDKLREMVDEPDGTPILRGAGYGILFSFGATRERVVARELTGYLRGSPERVLQAGSFLDGLFLSSKSVFLGSDRLLRAINEVVAELDWDTFKLLLPDLRRAFSQFIPSEIDRISARVSEEIGVEEAPSPDEPVPAGLSAAGAAADARVTAHLEGWL